jgi:hypothetical protein
LADQIDPNRVTIGPTRFRYLAAACVLGALVGYTLVPFTQWMNGTAPTITRTSVGVLAVIACVLAILAYSTYRTVHRDRLLIEPHRAVNLLLLAKACALMGAFFAGGYLGFGSQFLDSMDIVLPRERVFRSAAAAAAAVAIVICALLLERACRIPRDPEE